MKKILLGIISLFLIMSVGYCQDQPLQLTIKSDKEVYEVGEEIAVIITVTNIGNKPEEIFVQGPAFYTYGYHLTVDGDSGELRVAFFAADPKPQTTVLQPSQQHKVIVKCASTESKLSCYGFLFSSLLNPGKHTISAYYQKPSLTSNIITIEVLPKDWQPDLSSPKTALLSYKKAILARNWKEAEKCLSEEFRKVFKIPLQDRRFFDYYTTEGFLRQTAGILPLGVMHDAVDIPMALKGKFSVQLSPKLPPGSEATYFCEITFIKEEDGWKIEDSSYHMRDYKKNFDEVYNSEIPDKFKGSAKKLEAE